MSISLLFIVKPSEWKRKHYKNIPNTKKIFGKRGLISQSDIIFKDFDFGVINARRNVLYVGG